MAFFTRDKQFYHDLFRLMLVVALQNVVAYSVNVADNLMLGSFSQEALSGAATVNQIQFMLQQITVAVGNGMVMLNSQYWGKRELSPIRTITGIALKVSFLLGILVFLAAALFPRAILSLFTSDQAIIAAGLEYLELLKYTYLFYVLTTTLLASLRSVETVNIAFWVSLMSLIVNVCINYVLIFGNFGFPRLGLRGAAIGTLIARVLEFAVVLFYVLCRDQRLRLFSENPFRRDKSLARDFRKTTVPVVTTSFLWSLATPIQTGILGRLSADAIAANSVSTTLFQYMKVVTLSEASSTSVLIGRTIGAGRLDLIRPYTRTLQAIFLGMGFALGGLLFVIRTPILSLYSLTPTALELADQLIQLMVLIYVGMAYQMPVSGGIIQGGGDSRFTMKVNIFSTWAIVMPLSFLGAFVWDLPVFWVVFLLNSDQLFKCVPMAIHVNRYRWIRVLTREKT